MKKWLLCFTLSFSFQSQARWNLNDVSFLLPLPHTLEQNQLLSLKSQGHEGLILDPELVMQIPRLAVPFSQEEVIKTLRVIAVRIDPCFPLPTPLKCQKQIRLVWQPVTLNAHGEVTAVDAALHSFYKIEDTEFDSLLNQLSEWKKKYSAQTDGLPLQVHPAWASDPESQALNDFQKIILGQIGPRNLFRVTAMLLRGAGDMWAFENFEFKEGLFEMQPLPRLNGQRAQVFVNQAIPADHYEGLGMNPPPQSQDTIQHLVGNSSENLKGNEDLVLNEFQVLARIENPRAFNAENMDCVSCHVSQAVKHWVLNNRGDLKPADLLAQIQYQNPRSNLQNLSPEQRNTQNLRGFGYFGQSIAISQRVINESAEVADLINQYRKD